MKEKAFVSWSGGKDSYLALFQGGKSGLDVRYLLTFTGREGRTMAHGLSRNVLERQAAALGISLETEAVSWESYEQGFREAVSRLKQKGISGGIFGDVNLAEHREWVEKMGRAAGITTHLPLWGMQEEEVLRQVLQQGSRLLIVALRRDLLDEKWLGREVDEDFCRMCLDRGISPCGERGEYHTLVVDGELFQTPLKVHGSGIYRRDRHSLLKIN